MLEAEFWQEMRDHIVGPQWTRIESPDTASGIPDVHGFWGVDTWIELKSMERGLKLPHNLSPFQVGWLLKRSSMGGRCFIAVRVQKPNWGDGIVIWPGSAAREVYKQGLNAVPLADLVSTDGVPWSVVAALLFGQWPSHKKEAW